LQAKGGQFTIPHDDDQLIVVTGVFAHHIATFPYSTLSKFIMEVKDANGNLSQDDDAVLLIKDLKVRVRPLR